ncbi:META domain-containing protein [Aliiroseovarius marinus]|uniref:META domain-containing protein n=1 Tax=Aliiroseovarius marinus TaxID=2500159 RepID=UPI003D7D8F92
MKHILFVAAATTLLSACKDETISGYADPEAVWELTELNGSSFDARATIRFPEQGKITGQAPCNRYFSAQKAPYPWFETGPIAATKMACADLEAETQFFAALEKMSQSEALGSTLILSNEKGDEMVFKARKN